MREPLEVLGDRALGWLGDAVTRPGPDDPAQRAPRLCRWLATECGRELLRRSGVPVGAAAPLNLAAFTEADLAAGLEFSTLWTIASRQTGVALFETDPEGAAAAQELVAFGETLAEAIRGALAMLAPAGTTH